MGSPMFLIVPQPSIPLCSASGFSGLVATVVAALITAHWDSSYPWGLWLPFYLGCSPIELWDSLSTYVHLGIACLASWTSDWLGALWASLSGIQSSMTFVRLNVIAHC